MNMKISFTGMLSNAARCLPEHQRIEAFGDEGKEFWDLELGDLEGCITEEMIQYGAMYKNLLLQTIDNIKLVTKDPTQLEGFLELYCMPLPGQHMKDVISFYEEQNERR